MFECLVLYILSNVLCCFIIGVCQWVHLYESLYDCVSCPVYVVERLMLFHHGCVSVSSSEWKFVWLCVLSCICCRTSYVVSSWVCVSEFIWMKVCMIVCLVLYMLFHHGCVSVSSSVWKFVRLCVLSCIYCRTSYVVSSWVCVSEFIWMKVCMIVCLVLYMLSNVLCCFNMGVCQWVRLYESLSFLCVLSCICCQTSYVVSLWVCVSEFICMKVCIFVCLVLYMLSNVLCCFNMGACQWVHLNESLYVWVSCLVYNVIRLMLFHFGCVSVSSSVWKFVYLCVLSCIYCRTSYVVPLWVCVSEFIWMKVCMFECLVLYIMSYVLCCFILGVCQWVHLYESLYVWVSCPVYIVERLMLFHYRCVSVSSSVWKFVRLCVLSCICCRTSYVVSSWVCVSEFIWMKVCMIVCLVLYMLSNVLCCFIMGVCQWVHLNESLYDCVSCPVYVVSSWVCVSEFICMKVCTIVCLVLYILSNVLCCFIMGVCQWVHLNESLYDCVSCPVYVVERLMLFQYGCVSVSSSVWKFVFFVCLVMYMLSNVLCCFIMGVCQWVHLYESLYICVSCPVYVVERLMLFQYGCVSVSSSVWKFVRWCVLSCICCRTSYVVSSWVCVSEFIWMKVCTIVCLVLYILSNVLCCFIMGVCQWVHLNESLYDCVSCPVYVVERLMLFHHGCVSVSSSEWKFVCLSVLSCIYCRTSYVVSFWVCVSEFICMKVCMFECLVLYMLSNVLCCFILGVCQWVHLYESLYVWVSCPVYIVERLMLFHFGCVSVSSSVWKFVCLSVLSCIYCRTSYVVSL